MNLLLVFATVFSVLAVLTIGGIVLCKWLQRRADLRIWAERERQLQHAPREESQETWRENQRMWMR
jgi:hypothetical protein